MTTVIATDGSELAKRAVDAGLDLARATGDTVVLVASTGVAIPPPSSCERGRSSIPAPKRPG